MECDQPSVQHVQYSELYAVPDSDDSLLLDTLLDLLRRADLPVERRASAERVQGREAQSEIMGIPNGRGLGCGIGASL